MFAIYNYSFAAVISFVLMSLCSFSLAHDDNEHGVRKKINNAVCNVSGECALDISDIAKKVTLACEAPKAEVTWNRLRSNLFLIACDCECTSHDNAGWLVNKDIASGEYKIWKLGLGKRYTVEQLSRPLAFIPDLFRSHPLCYEPDKRLLSLSVFISLEKYPSGGGVSPYCFSPIYIMEENKRLIVEGGDANDVLSEFRQSDDSSSAIYAEILNIVNEIE